MEVGTLKNWLALWHTPNVGPISFKKQLQNDPELQKLPAIAKPNWKQVEYDLAWQEQGQCHIITINDYRYPKQLQEIYDSPPLLYVHGDLECLTKPQIALIGSRNASSAGRQIAAQFALTLAELGFVVTSGMAIGIDTASHEGALSSKQGKTIAVLGSGLNCLYPAINKPLSKQIIERGAILSEHTVNTEPKRMNFPRRNRLISGLSMGVLIVEASKNSGSLITAKAALDQGREVFAIPGSIHSARHKGCHSLIREGAKLVESIDDILEELGGVFKGVKHSTVQGPPCQQPLLPLDSQYERVLQLVGYETTSVDMVVMQSGRAASEISAMLLQLELKGYIISVPGGYARILTR